MFIFADLLRQAQQGQALDNLAAAYGLSRSDLERLTATLLPVFQLGLQQSVTDPARFAHVADLFDPKKFAGAYEDMRAALSPAAIEAGRLALEKLFGSREAAKVVAGQAADISGIGADVVSEAMPALAATIFGGIASQIAQSPLAPLFKAWTGNIDTASDPVGAVLNPYRNGFAAFLKGYSEGKDAPASGPSWQGMEAFGHMFEAGVSLSEQNCKAFERILDTYRVPRKSGETADS